MMKTITMMESNAHVCIGGMGIKPTTKDKPKKRDNNR